MTEFYGPVLARSGVKCYFMSQRFQAQYKYHSSDPTIQFRSEAAVDRQQNILEIVTISCLVERKALEVVMSFKDLNL